MPGPGAYGVPAEPARPGNAKGSAAFAVAVAGSRSTAAAAEGVPGPGAYDRKDRGRAPIAGASAFRSGTQRFGTKQAAARAGSAPGPGSYTPVRSEQSDMLAFALPTATFRSKTSRLARNSASASVTDEFPSDPVFGYNGRHAQSARAKLRKDDRLTTNVGPGAYNPKLDPEFDMSAHRKSSMFSNHGVGRFGTSTKANSRLNASDDVPGPGHYAVDVSPAPRKPLKPSEQEKMRAIEGKIFGAAPRFQTGLKSQRAPGPAYYNPKRPDPRSYHLNLARRWI